MLLEPKQGEFNAIVNELSDKHVQNRSISRMSHLVSRSDMKQFVENKFVWPEQQYLTARYSGKWTSVNPRFFGLQGYPHWKVLYGLQYGGDKPFVLDSKFDIKTRIQYPDYILWHQYYKEILIQYPELTTSIALTETNEFHKYFHSSLKRQTYDHVTQIEPTRKLIADMYGIPDYTIHDNQITYYHVNKSGVYRHINMEPMWDDIPEYDYVEPIKRLSKYFEKTTNYYSKILKLDVDMNMKQRLDMHDKVNPSDRDLIMTEYVKCRPNTYIVTIWPIVTKYIDIADIFSLLNSHGNVYYAKTLSLSKKGLFNLMFAMYDEFTFSARNEFLKKKMDYMETSELNNVTVFVFDNVKNMNISGQGAQGKTVLRNAVLDMMKKVKKFDNIRGNDVMHINDHFYQTIEYAQMMFNENTIDFLETQNIDNYISPFLSLSHLNLQTYKKWIFSNMSLLEMTRLIAMGGIILYLYGIRLANDIDGFYVSTGVQSDDLNKLMETNFVNETTKFPFADIGIEGSNSWRDIWTKKNDEVWAQFDIESTVDLATNPQNYFYYQGVKFYLLKHEIVRKLLRNRKQDHRDFFMLITLYPTIISQYVQLSTKLDLVYVKNISTPPKITVDYMKVLIGMIKKRYLASDFNKFYFRYRTDK